MTNEALSSSALTDAMPAGGESARRHSGGPGRGGRPRQALPGGRALRLTAVGLAAAVTLAGGVVACGRVSVKQQADAAAGNLAAAKVVSFTLRLDDPKGSLASTAEDKRTLGLLRDSAVTVTIDPAGDATFGTAMAQTAVPGGDPAAALKHSGSVDISYTHAGKAVVVLRLDGGVLYLRVDPAQIQAITGQPLPLDSLNGPGVPPGLDVVAEGVKSGKWLSLDLSSLYERVAKARHGAGFGALGGAQPLGGNLADIRSKIIAAVTANTTSTSSVGHDGEVLISVRVAVRGALQGLLDALAGLPGLGAGPLASARAQLAQVPEGTLNGTVTIAKGHYTRVGVDLHSLAVLSRDPSAISGTEGTQLVVDIDDRAAPVTAPTGDQVVQLDTLAAAMIGPILELGPAGLAGLAG